MQAQSSLTAPLPQLKLHAIIAAELQHALNEAVGEASGAHKLVFRVSDALVNNMVTLEL